MKKREKETVVHLNSVRQVSSLVAALQPICSGMRCSACPLHLVLVKHLAVYP